MKIGSVIFNDPAGEFRVLNDAREAAFDSRLVTQRIHLQGVTDIAGRSTSPAPGGGVALNPSAAVSVVYGKTFARSPYVLCASRRLYPGVGTYPFGITTDKIYPPYIGYAGGGPVNYLSYAHGFFSNAGTSQLFIGNLDSTDLFDPSWNGSRRAWYAVFDNPIGAS